MVNDPYSVLGVSKDATEEELKAAYRKLVKKYHPDRFTDASQKARAEEKMKEINEAYERALDIKSGKASGQGYGGTGYGSQSGVYYRVRMSINAGRFTEAESILQSVPYAERNAEWHFLTGIIQYRRGWIYDAANSISQAMRMDPDNAEYRSAYEQIQRMSSASRSRYTSSQSDSSCDMCDICTALACANCICSCCRG